MFCDLLVSCFLKHTDDITNFLTENAQTCKEREKQTNFKTRKKIFFCLFYNLCCITISPSFFIFRNLFRTRWLLDRRLHQRLIIAFIFFLDFLPRCRWSYKIVWFLKSIVHLLFNRCNRSLREFISVTRRNVEILLDRLFTGYLIALGISILWVFMVGSRTKRMHLRMLWVGTWIHVILIENVFTEIVCFRGTFKPAVDISLLIVEKFIGISFEFFMRQTMEWLGSFIFFFNGAIIVIMVVIIHPVLQIHVIEEIVVVIVLCVIIIILIAYQAT